MSTSGEPQLPKIPVTVITGFLGAGKTTLVNHILTGNHGKKIAIIENEYGEIGIDDGLVVDTKEELYEMNNGCVCCTVRGDLIRILNRLLKRKTRLDAILIETTGLADPAPVAQTFFVDDDLKRSLRLDAILTVVDAKHATRHLDEQKPDGVVNEAVQQVAFADKILLNKVDLVTAEEKTEVLARCRAINAAARIIECRNSAVPLDSVLEQHAFDLERIMAAEPGFLKLEETAEVDGHSHEHAHEHGEGCVQCEAGDEGDARRHHHHEHEHGEGCEECAAGDTDHPHHGHKHAHKHDDHVSSVGIELEGSIDMKRLNKWLGALLETKGADLYRSKGILSVAGSADKVVFQGVHMMLQFASSAEGLGRPWRADERRTCRAVFIGKDLDRAALTEGFRSCAEGA